jgi:hypothetical protein
MKKAETQEKNVLPTAEGVYKDWSMILGWKSDSL